MAYRHIPSAPNTSPSYPYSKTAAHHGQQPSLSGQNIQDDPAASSPTMRKRQRTGVDISNPAVADPQQQPPQQPPHQQAPHLPQQGAVAEDGFINDQDAAESAGDDDDEEEKPKDKKAGRRKIKIEFIQDKSRRHITFSKRKAGIMKKAYELSTLTGTQVLLLVVSETGLVYTFTTAKLQPLVTQPEGKNLIQACLNSSAQGHGGAPPNVPVGVPMNRATQSIPMPPGGTTNLPGGLSIPGGPVGGPGPVKEDGDDDGDDEVTHGGRTASAGDKRRRRPSTTAASAPGRTGPGSPQTPNSAIPPPLSIPGASQHQPSAQAPPPPQISLGSPTSPQQQHSQVPSSPQYGPSPTGGYAPHGQHHGHHAGSPTDASMYGGHMMPGPPYSYPGPGGPAGQGGQPLGGLAAAAAQHNHWAQAPQGGHYGRR